MDEKKLKNDKLLDIPDFLRRLDENRSENAPEVAEQPMEEKIVEEETTEKEPVEEKPKRPSIQDRMRKRLMYIVGDIDDAFENEAGLFLILLLNSAIIFDLSWPLSTCHKPSRKKVIAKKIKKIVIFFPGLNLLNFIY